MATPKYYRPLDRSIAGLVASWTDLILPNVTDDAGTTLDNKIECAVKVTTTGDAIPYTHKLEGAGTIISELNGWTYQGCQDIIQMLELTAPRDLSLFAVPRKILDNGTKLDSNTVLGAYTSDSQGFTWAAIKGHKKDASKYRDSNSILYATDESPVWYMDQGKVWIYPFNIAYSKYVTTIDYPKHAYYWTNANDATFNYTYTLSDIAGSEVSKDLEVVDHYIAMQDELVETESNNNDTNSSPNKVYRAPEKYNVAIALFVAIELLRYRQRQLWKQLPPVLDYTGSHGDADEDSMGWEKVRWYIEEDEDQELTSMKIAELNGEQQKFVLDYQWYQKTEGELVQKYQQFFQNETQKKDQ